MNKPSSYFATDHLKSDLKRRTVRGATATFVGQGTKFLLQIASTMVLARLLTPNDFGLVAMVTAVTGFIMIFKDLGLSMATVQREEINHAQISTLFWINLALSALLMLITLALAPVIAWFYGDTRLTAITAALSVAFLFGGLTVQHQALLRRQMHLTVVTFIDVIAMSSGILAAIICAWIGLEYWSLVWMQIVTALATAIGVWIASGWVPGLPTRSPGVRSMLKFGGYLSAFNIMNFFVRNLDNVLIGRFHGAEPLGMYSRAYSLLLLPIGQITAPMTAVAVPALSLLQNEPERYRIYYLKAVKLIAYLSMPLVGLMGILSDDIIQLVLGENWLAASPIFKALSLAAFWGPVGSTVGWIYISLGQTKRMFMWSSITVPLHVLAFLIGVQWGATGVALAHSIFVTTKIIPQMWYALLKSPVSLMQLFSAIRYPFILSITISVCVLATSSYLTQQSIFASLAISLIIASLATFLLVLINDPIKNDFRDLRIMVMNAINQKRLSTAG